MKANFSEKEKKILKGHYSLIARKYGGTHTTISSIISGKADINTDLTKKLFNGIKETLEFLSPKES